MRLPALMVYNLAPVSWARRFAIRESIRGSLWLIPLIGAILGGLLGAGLFQHDRVVDLPSYWTYSPSTAGTLLFFFHRFIQRVRPVAAAALVAGAGKRAFDESVRALAASEVRAEPPAGIGEPTLVVRATRAGCIQAVDLDGLVGFALEREAQLVFAHAVGDFVPEGAVLLRAHGVRAGSAADASRLRGLIALGDERTIQEDPAFAIRILVDIAIRALSPAVNDPTTAVQVLDYLGETLGHIGASPPRLSAADGGVGPCVVVRHRRWEDFLALGVTEIREYGADSIQVVRRLRAMLEELRASVPPDLQAAVGDELRRLDGTVDRAWRDSVDFDRASVAGAQGIGGPST